MASFFKRVSSHSVNVFKTLGPSPVFIAYQEHFLAEQAVDCAVTIIIKFYFTLVSFYTIGCPYRRSLINYRRRSLLNKRKCNGFEWVEWGVGR